MTTLSDDPSIETPKSTSGSYKWAVVGMLWFICFFNYADRVAISSVFPILKDKFHFTGTELGIIGSAFSWVYAGAAPFAGWFGDQVSRKRVIIGGLYIWSIVTGFTGLCGKFWQFVLVRATEGLGETFYIPASMSLISDYHGKGSRSLAIGLHQTSIYGGTVFGGFLAGWMAARYGWQSPFVFLGSAGILLGLVLAAFIREPVRGRSDANAVPVAFEEQHDARATDHLRRQLIVGGAFGLVFGILLWQVFIVVGPVFGLPPVVFGMALGITIGVAFRQSLSRMFGAICAKPAAIWLLLGFTGTNSVAMVFLTWAPSYLHEVYKVPVSQAGFFATAPIQFGSMAGAILGGTIADRLRLRMKGGRIIVQAIGTLLGIPFLALCGFTPSLNVVLVTLTCFGIAKGIHDSNISAGFFDVVHVKNRAAAVGLLNFVGWGAGALWTVTFGWMVDKKVAMSSLIGYNAAIYAVVAVIFLYAAFVRAPKDIAD